MTSPQPPLLDLARLFVAIRRRRRLWASLALLGLVAGAVLAMLAPAQPTASVRVFVVHEDDQPSDTGSLISTDVAVLTTTKIASAALKRLGSTERPEEFLRTYSVTSLTNNLLEVTAEGDDGADAARRARALADAFVADHVGRVRAAARAEADALLDQRTQLRKELGQTNTRISRAEADAARAAEEAEENGTEPPVQPNAAGLDTLYARRAELTSQISDLGGRAEEAGIGAPRVEAGTQVVDAPRPKPPSLLKAVGVSGGIGLVLGLVAGVAFAAVTGLVRDRPVLRKDIAAHLGASVIAQLPVPRRGPPRLWRRSLAERERGRVAATLVRLVRDGGPVSVLELGAPRVAAALVLDMAVELATELAAVGGRGTDVVIVDDPAGRVVADDLPGRDLARLTGGAERPIRIVGADEANESLPPAGGQRLGIGSVAPATAWTDLPHLGAETILVVRAGFASTEWLHTVARQLADCQLPIIGVVLVDPDPRDGSDGTLWDGLHTALRGRAGPTARTNGTLHDADLPTKRFAPVQPHLANRLNGTNTGAYARRTRHG